MNLPEFTLGVSSRCERYFTRPPIGGYTPSHKLTHGDLS